MSLAPLLIVEDNPEDLEVLTRALKRLGFSRPLAHCRTSEEAWELLSGPAARPALVLLDLNLPGAGGRDLLLRLKAEAALKHIPVVVISSSSAPADVEFCYKNGAAGYQVKIMDVEAQRQALRATLEYWFQAVVLPSGE